MAKSRWRVSDQDREEQDRPEKDWCVIRVESQPRNQNQLGDDPASGDLTKVIRICEHVERHHRDTGSKQQKGKTAARLSPEQGGTGSNQAGNVQRPEKIQQPASHQMAVSKWKAQVESRMTVKT